VWNHFRKDPLGPTSEQLLEELARALKDRRDPEQGLEAIIEGRAVVALTLGASRVCIIFDPDRLTEAERNNVGEALTTAFVLAKVQLGRACPVLNRVRNLLRGFRGWGEAMKQRAVRLRALLPRA
jgi:hypothetical protein